MQDLAELQEIPGWVMEGTARFCFWTLEGSSHLIRVVIPLVVDLLFSHMHTANLTLYEKHKTLVIVSIGVVDHQ